MGDRVSIAFRNDGWQGDDDGVTLFHHWGGAEFPQVALHYARELKREMSARPHNISDPLSRLEPRVVMVDFIRWLLEETNWLTGKVDNGEMKGQMMAFRSPPPWRPIRGLAEYTEKIETRITNQPFNSLHPFLFIERDFVVDDACRFPVPLLA